ncbi:RING-type domain-containing protein [Meloidogyne graminicola]|uniref:RING-type domain-containing protein n=1 Tax=Meloidogyne graminicola TaxID=189291 RepID=A0A8S9Z7U9_9BILA|nr:RING-type domain-containing protein [Meloidogyne graminicola]
MSSDENKQQNTKNQTKTSKGSNRQSKTNPQYKKQNNQPPQNTQTIGQTSGGNQQTFRRDFRQQKWQQNKDRSKHFKNLKTKDRTDHAGIPMIGEISDCLICCQRSDLFGLGECMHPICMECSLRIRVIGEAKQCPQCRADIPILYYVSAPPGQKLLLRLPSNCIDHKEYEEKYSVCFESKYALECFNSYIANRCKECTKSGQQVEFLTFAELRSHMSQEHQLTFCRICCDNLNVLVKDRQVYTRETLQLHMNGKLKSEKDGFRGHPTCHFCEERFYDEEQQYRHLRKEHYFCQFCHQEGLESNVFYRNQHQLNQHNRQYHHPCLDQECLQMGIVFVSDVELNVHKTKQHHRLGQNGTGSSRGGTIPLEFQFVPSRAGRIFRRVQDEDIDNESVVNQRNEQKTSSQTVRIVPSAQSHQKNVKIVKSSFENPLQSTGNFPSLTLSDSLHSSLPYGAPPGFAPILPSNNLNVNNLPLSSVEQFPSLSGGTSTSTSQFPSRNAVTVWGQKSNKDLFTSKPGNKLAKNKGEEPKRKTFVPAQECWPEEMLKKLKARELGLPDPEPIEPPHWLNPPKKEKKRKIEIQIDNNGKVDIKDVTGQNVGESSRGRGGRYRDERSHPKDRKGKVHGSNY